jgi:hypothetical protein
VSDDQIIPTTVIKQLLNVLAFYGNERNIEWVTFQKGKREQQLKRLQNDSSWQQTGEDHRGHEEFRENGKQALDVLSALEQALPDSFWDSVEVQKETI